VLKIPYKKTSLKGGKVRITGPSGVHMKAGTKKNAEAQLRLLHGVERGWTPTKGKKQGIPERK
jgi:hypothetical protein